MCGFFETHGILAFHIRYPVPCARFQVPGAWHLRPNGPYRIDAGGRIPSTEDRAGDRAWENAYTGYAILRGMRYSGYTALRRTLLGRGYVGICDDGVGVLT
jgi:hypothetical protein